MNKQESKTKKILIVDDDESTLEYFSTVLAREGFNVTSVPSGEKALQLLRAGLKIQFDLVMLDLMMPGQGGYNVLKELQKSGYQDVPIFIITARQLEHDAINMILTESNVKGFFTKPVDPKKFNQKVHSHLGTIVTAIKK